jgi:elongation factor G
MPEDEKKLSQIRNIGIIAHIDAGKTTTTERILFHSGKTHKIGEVHEGKATMDFMDQEQERGITIQSAATTVYWQNYQVNIIDTPGHVDFTAEVERSLRVLDGGIVVLDGKKGVEAQTETVWRQAKKYKVPRIIFINKMDGVDRIEKFDENLKSIRDKLQADPLPVQFPIGVGRDLKGLVDIVEQKAYYCELGNEKEEYQIKDIPSELLEKTKKYRQELIGKIIDQDDNLAAKYLLEGKDLSIEEIKSLLRKATLTGNYYPTFCGSAYKYLGIKLVLNGVVDYLPSPYDIPGITVFSPQDKNKQEVVNYDSNLPCLALVFKIVVDKYNNKLTFFRVYYGKVLANSYVYNVNKGRKERISRLVRMSADDQEEIKEVGAGDIAAAIGLNSTVTGDTFGDENNPLVMEKIDFAETVISQAIEPKTNEDKDKLVVALEKLKVQDPSFRYWIDQETRQMIIAGMGELHLDVMAERLRREYKLELETKPPKISYRETITKEIENLEAWYKKKTGGRGHDARIWVNFEPNKGKGFEFVDAKKGQDMSDNDAKEVREGIEEAMSSGLLLNYPILDVKVTLLGGKRHAVDTQPGDFKSAAILAFRGDSREEKKEKAEKMGAVLLEPIMQVEVIVPKDYMGDILANLASRRAIIESTEEKEGETYISSKTPLKEILNYANILRQLTKGRGTYSMELAHYQEVPNNVLEEILKEEKL